MYRAEIHGKLSAELENREDILTSNVFSFFKYSDRRVFLFEFFKLIGLDVTKKESKSAEFHFWPSYDDRTQPDLVLIVGPFYILIEAKYHSGFGQETIRLKHQLVREFHGGQTEAVRLDKKFVLVAITADPFYKPEVFTGVPDYIYNQINWINWQAITLMIDKILEQNLTLTGEKKEFAEDLFLLLQKKGLRSYIGIESLQLDKTINPLAGNLFFDLGTIKYKGIFSGFQAISLHRPIETVETHPLFFGAQQRLFTSLESFEKIEDVKQEIFWRE